MKSEKYNLIIEKINLYLCLLLVFFIPLYKEIVPPLIILLILTWLLEAVSGGFKNKFHTGKLKNNGIFFLLIFFYLFHLIGLLWTDDISAGKFDLQVKLSLLIFPLFFIATNELYAKNRDKILISFTIGNFIAAIICIIVAFYNSVDFIDGKLDFNAAVMHKDYSFFYSISQDDNYFFYEYFSIFHHPTYFSLYLVFSIICLLFFLENPHKSLIKTNITTQKNLFVSIFNENLQNYYIGNISSTRLNSRIRFFCYFLIVFFSIIIFLLSSRAGIISLFIVFIGKILIELIESKKKIYIISLIIAIFLGGVFIRYNPRFGNFFTTLLSTCPVQGVSGGSDSSIADLSAIAGGNQVRIFLWEIGIEIVRENLLLGVGTGDAHKEMNKKFDFYNFNYAKTRNLNVHNQFLETFIGIGIFSLSVLLLIFIIPLIYAIKEKNFLLLFFLIIVGFNFLFESMLNTQAGVVFFAFFYSFLNTRFIVINNNYTKGSQILENTIYTNSPA